MTGIILVFNNSSNQGIISAVNGQRYSFMKEDYNEQSLPAKNIKVDFEVTEENKAIDIYTVRDHFQENTNTILGIVALGITFFLGFIGTLISRVAIAKESFGAAIIPTIIHFVITILIFIPVVGWLIYIMGTGYYMYKNYILTVNKKQPVNYLV